MNYVQRYIDAMNETLPDCDPALNKLYALLAMTTGVDTTLEDVHNAWGLWTVMCGRDTHHSLIPFKQLDQNIQYLDIPYRDAIIFVAEEME